MTADPKDPQQHQAEGEKTQAGDLTSRRSFLSRNIKRAAYIAPIVWSVSARQALAATNVSGLSGPPDPE